MGLFAQEFHAHFLGLQRIFFRVGGSEDLDLVGDEFHGLPAALRLYEGTGGANAGVETDLPQGFFRGVLEVQNDLEIVEGTAIVQGNEPVAAKSTYPPLDGDGLLSGSHLKHFGYFGAARGHRFHHFRD